MNKRIAITAVAGLIGVAGFYLMTGSQEEAEEPTPQGGTATREPPPPISNSASGSRSSSGAERGSAAFNPEGSPEIGHADSEPQSFDGFPDEYRRDHIAEAIQGLQTWIEREHPDSHAELLELDCEEAPCIVTLEFPRSAFSGEEEGGAFWGSFRAKLTANLGWAPNGDLLDEDDPEYWRAHFFGVPPSIVGQDNRRFEELSKRSIERTDAY